MQQHKLSLGQIEISNLTQRKIAILGGTGSGKTSTLKMLASVSPVPTIIFDPLNVINISGWDRVLFRKGSKDQGKEAGRLFARTKPRNIIFAFQAWLQEELSPFINDFFSAWSPRSCLICFDEVHEFVPEGGVGGQYAPEVERAIRHWRNQDVGFLYTSQRPALVKKNVLALSDYVILYRITWEHDLRSVKKLIQNLPGVNSEEVLEQLQTKPFLNGYALDFRYDEK